MLPPAIGAIVTHAKFGSGTVTAVAGTGDDCKLSIRFDDGSDRQLVARFVTWEPPPASPPSKPPEPPLEERLLAAIVAAPESDDARLVYADLLSQRNDPRGEFIAVQCELARAGVDPGRRAALEAREAALLDGWRHTWLGRFYQLFHFRFARGFLEEVGTSAEAFAHYGDALLTSEPVRRLDLYFTNGRKIPPRCVQASGLARVRDLRLIGGSLTEAVFAALAGSPHLTNLQTLSVGKSLTGRWKVTSIDAAAAQALASWPHENLAHLALEHCALTHESAGVLGGSPYLRGVQVLLVNKVTWPEGTEWLETLLGALGTVREVAMNGNSEIAGPVLELLGFRPVSDCDRGSPVVREVFGGWLPPVLWSR